MSLKSLMIPLLGGLWLGSSALADDDVSADSVVARKVKKLPKLAVPSGPPPGQLAYEKLRAQYEGREYEPEAYIAQQVINLDPRFTHNARKGLHLIYLREYKGAREQFFQLGKDFPGWGIGPVGEVLVWQALMLENFDFRFEVQYQTALRKSQSELQAAMELPGNDAWEFFLMAGVLGIDSIHTMRHEEWMRALSRGYEAMKMVAKVKELAPDFTDIRVGDGLFNYWVTVVSKSTKAIPDMGDKRGEGVADMRRVESQGIFLAPAATLALTFTWIEEGQKAEALKTAQRNAKRYPNNIINNLVLARVMMYNNRYADSEKMLKHVQATDPKNRRSHYYLARLYLRWKKIGKAIASLDSYLQFSNLDKRDRGMALYYKGIAHQRLKQWDLAEAAYRESWKVSRLDRSKRRLESLDKVKERAATPTKDPSPPPAKPVGG
jgi:tetratricopeptide (TPR) repeat protein